MPLASLVRQLEQAALTADLAERSQRHQRLRIGGGARLSRALVASALARQQRQSQLVVVPTLEEAGRWAALLEQMGWPSVLLYPTSEGTPYESFDPTSEIIYGQLSALAELLASSRPLVVVASERALQPHLPPRKVLETACFPVQRGSTHDLGALGERLGQLGYERVATVEQEGTWSRRGDIVDLYPVNTELPLRLEFFGDDLEKLREFDPANQRSLDAVAQTWVTPTSYGPLIGAALRADLPDGLDALLGAEAFEQLLAGGTPQGLRRLLDRAFAVPPASSTSFPPIVRWWWTNDAAAWPTASSGMTTLIANCRSSAPSWIPPRQHSCRAVSTSLLSAAWPKWRPLPVSISVNCTTTTATPTVFPSPHAPFRPPPTSSANRSVGEGATPPAPPRLVAVGTALPRGGAAGRARRPRTLCSQSPRPSSHRAADHAEHTGCPEEQGCRGMGGGGAAGVEGDAAHGPGVFLASTPWP